MKHLVVIVLLVAGVIFLLTKKTDVDRLMQPVGQFSAQQVGNRFVDPGTLRLPVRPDELAERGVTTIVYFHDETCPACLSLDGNLDAFLKIRPDVAVRKVAMTPGNNGYTDAIRDYRWRIYMAPCILLFDRNGKLIAADDRTDSTGQDLLIAWMNAEFEKRAQ